jgi:cytochrome c-type biogenesis protein CcmH
MKRLVLVLLLACGSVVAQPRDIQEPLTFDTPQQEERFKNLTEELRCTVCQNQSLADSDAPLAHDLREQLHELLMEGRSDEEIKTFLVDRYGDFVLYRPPVQGNTLILWVAPIVLLLIGFGVVYGVVRQRRRMLDAGVTGETE